MLDALAVQRPGDRRPMRRVLIIAAFTLAAMAQMAGLAPMAGFAAGPAYPARTVRLILPFGAASATDITARLFADRLSARWGKPVVVENRPGGDGLVALNAFIGARDDHMLFFGPAAIFLVHLFDEEKPSYNLRDIAPISQVYVTVLAISVPASLNIGTIDELVALARAQPGKLNAAAATGNSDFLIFGFHQIARLADRQSAVSRHYAGAQRPRRRPHSDPVKLARRGAADVPRRTYQSSLGDQQAACTRPAGDSNRGRGRLSRIDHGNERWIVRTAANAPELAREHCARFPRDCRKRSDHRQAARRYRSDHDAARACRIHPQHRRAKPAAWGACQNTRA